jgi:Ca-activated chloride channel family protein
MRFEHPNLLWLLLVIPPALSLFFWWAELTRQKLLTQFVEARLLSQLTVGLSATRRKVRAVLVVSAAAFLIIALARPQHGFDLQEVEQRGLDIVVAVDTSKSMLATDIPPNRLARAKLATQELMQRAGTDRMGLVAFAGDAFLQCPLTIDNTAFQQSLAALDVNSIPQGGTALAAAIDTALAAFKEKNHFKVLVLLSDGEDNDDGALAAAKKAAEAGLKIFTIGIGLAEGALVQVADASGKTDYVRDEQGNVVKSHLNETLLRQIASAGGGFYLPLRGADTINTLYERGLEPLPKSEGKEKLVRRYHEQFQWPLALAILLLLIEITLPERQSSFRGAPKTDTQRAESARASKLMALVLLIFLLSSSVFASPTDALRDYKAGNFTNAVNEYERLAQVYTNDLRLVFNAGAAAYRGTNYDAAAKAFTLVTTAPDLKLQQQAYYNLGNTQFRQGSTAKDLDGLQQAWETAIKSYERAALLNTNDVDAAYNLAFTKNSVEQIKAFREALRRARAEADTAVRQRNYHRAVEIMDELMKNQIAAKQFEEFTKKLKDIDAIATPRQP